jgi:kumamolisin
MPNPYISSSSGGSEIKTPSLKASVSTRGIRHRSRHAGAILIVLATAAVAVMAFSSIHVQTAAGASQASIAMDFGAISPGLLQSLPQSYGYVPASAVPAYRTADATPVSFEIELAIPSTPQEQAFMNGLVTPGSPYYQHYLSPKVFVGMYGPSAQTTQSLVAYLQSSGLKVSSVDNLLLWKVSGTAAQVDQALHTTMWQWKDGKKLVMSPISEVQLPASLAPWVESFHCLNGFDTPQPMYQLSPKITSTAVSPTQMRSAYGSTALINGGDTGSAHEIGLAEMCDPGEATSTYTSDANSFDSSNGLPAVTLQFTGSGATTCTSGSSGWGTETDLDIQSAHMMAPGATLVVCLDDTDPDPSPCDSSFVSSGLIFGSNSWGISSTSYHSIWSAAKAAGVTLFASSGDSDAAVNYPAAEPDGLGVGGTSLTISGSGGYGSETVWNSGGGEGTGGGCDTADAPPSYQIGMTGYPGACGSTSDRGDPDVAMDADPNTGLVIITAGSSAQYGGTSLACPMWAASFDLIYQSSGFTGFGGAQVYALAKSTGYSTDFHDITTGTNGYSATVGWDPATGVGSPDVGQLAANFVVPLTGSLSPKASLVEAGTNVTLTAAVSGGSSPYTYQWELNGTAISGAPSTTTYVFAPPKAGSYQLSVKVTDKSSNSLTLGPVYVNATAGPSAAMTANPQTTLGGQTVQLTATANGGTAPYIKFVWSLNGSSIATTGTGSYKWTAPSHSANYTLGVRVYDSGGGSGFASTVVSVQAYTKPTVSLTVTPTGSVDVLNPVTLTASATGGDPPYSYVFIANGTTIIDNSTAPAYVWSPTGPGTYSVTVEVLDHVGQQATSLPSTVVVYPAVVVTLGAPSPSTVDVGQSATLTATASGGNAPYTYQWTVNGAVSSLSTTNKLVYPSTVAGQVTFSITVGDANGNNVTSSSVRLTVRALPTVLITGNNTPFTSHTDNLTASAGGGIGPYAYAWSVDGVPQTGYTGPVFAFNESANGSYQVIVSVTDSVNGQGTSVPFTVTVVNPPPAIIPPSPPWYENSPIPGVASAALGWLIILAIIMVVVGVIVAVHRRRRPDEDVPPIGVVCGSCGAGPYPWGVGGCPRCGSPFANVTPMPNSPNYVAYPNSPDALPPWPGPPYQ